MGGIQGKFLSDYFLDSVRYDKEVEFLQLTQRSKTVTKYAEKFKYLSHFYTLPLDDEWRYWKFKNGLRGDIRLMVAPLSIKDFAALVEKARVMEKMKNEVEGQCLSQQQQRFIGPSESKRDMRSRENHMTDPTISLKGLGAFFPSRAECSVSYVEALI